MVVVHWVEQNETQHHKIMNNHKNDFVIGSVVERFTNEMYQSRNGIQCAAIILGGELIKITMIVKDI